MFVRPLVCVVLGVVVGGCTKHNAHTCCLTIESCKQIGIDDGPRTCGGSQVCSDITCVDPQCATSADCPSTAPVCAGKLCIAACSADSDCATTPDTPYCGASGSCVACTSNAMCTTSAPTCDADSHSCRGCNSDDECGAGLCLEAEGTCIDAAAAAYVSMAGNDIGNCTKISPCLSVTFALAQLQGRSVIHIDGGVLSSNPVTINKPVYIDGTGTMINGPSTGPLFTIATGVTTTVSGLVISETSGPSLSVDAQGTLRLFGATVTGAIAVGSGTAEISHTTLTVPTLGQGVTCSGGSLRVNSSTFHHTSLYGSNCDVSAQQNTFDEAGDGTQTDALIINGGHAVVENNVLIDSNQSAQLANVTGTASGSTVRFNTFVNRSTVSGDGVALACDATVSVTSNVFAFASMHPHGGSICASRYSLYDNVAVSVQTGGTGNVTGDGNTFFVSRATGDFHLAAVSPALQKGETGTGVDVDHDGKPRPAPQGTAPDCGALEAP